MKKIRVETQRQLRLRGVADREAILPARSLSFSPALVPTARAARALVKASVAVLAVIGGVLVASSSVSAQAGPTAGCDGPHVTPFGHGFFGIEEAGNRLLSSSPTERTFSLASPLAAGTYDINAVSYDGYPDRDIVPAQPLESWFAELLSSDGVILATTASTGDVADLVVEATWAGPVGRVTISDVATMVRVKHSAPGDPNINSIRPVCLGAQPVAAELPVSQVAVTYENEGTAASTVALGCGGQEEAGTGRVVELLLDDIAAGTQCTVVYPVGADCDISLAPVDTDVTLADDALVVGVPIDGGAIISVGIVCRAGDVVSSPGDDDGDDGAGADDAAADDQDNGTQDSSAGVGTEVQGQAETATPKAAQPSFTG